MRFHKKLPLIILLIVSSTVTNCTVQKRSYRKGYYVSVNKKLKTAKPHTEKTKPFLQVAKKFEFVPLSQNILPQVQNDMVLITGANKKFETKKLKIKPLSMTADSCGDLVVMRDGSEVTVKITEVGSKVIRYKRCNNLNGPNVVVNTDNVFMIKFANGTKEVFKIHEPEYAFISDELHNKNAKPVVYEAKKMNGFALTSFVVSLLSWTLVLAPVSLIFGLIGISQSTNHPEKYYGKGFAVAGVIITLAVLFIFLLAIL